MKILAIKFKYLGDVAIAVPAMRAIREAYPNAELHWLVAEEALPIIEHIPWIDKKWGFPKKKSSGKYGTRFSILKQLRQEKFNISVDFVGNDRGAIASLVVGAKKRIGLCAPKGFLGRKLCYTKTQEEAPSGLHERLREIHLLSLVDIVLPKNTAPELYSDPTLKEYALSILPEGAIICHLSTTRPKKEWDIENWVKLYEDHPHLQDKLLFTSGPSEREQSLLEMFLMQAPDALHLKKIPSVAHFMALIKEAKGMICSDSLPSHLAGGLGTCCVVLFGPTTASQWDPRGSTNVLEAKPCFCLGPSHVCLRESHCLSSISPKLVVETLDNLIKERATR